MTEIPKITALPISEAPRDGTHIIAFYPLNGRIEPVVIRWSTYLLTPPYRPCWRRINGEEFLNPNNWLPIPELKPYPFLPKDAA